MTNPNFTTDPEFVTYAVGLLNRMPRSHPHAFHQNSFGAVLAVGRNNLAKRLAKYIEEYPTMSVQHATGILDMVWEQSVVMGIEAYAALSRSFEVAPDKTAIPFDEVWASTVERLSLESDAALGFHAALSRLGPIHALRDNAVLSINAAIEPLIEKMDTRRTLLGIAEHHFTLGMAVESSYVHCIAEKKQFNTSLVNLIESATGYPVDRNADDFDSELKARLAVFERPAENIYPWPEDEICACGQSLTPFIFCCDPHSPFSISEYRPQFSEEFKVHRPCCDQSFSGFVCDVCGRVYTWQKGTVASV